MPKKISKNTAKIDYSQVKSELLDDLEQFLLDQTDFDNAEKIIKKQSALKELDKLIRQDLSYNQILFSLKKQASSQLKIAEPKHRSVHVIDLRKQASEPIVQRVAQVQEIEPIVQKKFSRPKRKPKKNFSFSGFKAQHVLSKSFLFAFILLLVLLPIRGLSLFKKINIDSQKLFDFSAAGILNFEKGVLSASENSFDTAQVSFGQALAEFQEAQSILDEYNDWALNAASALPLVGSPISLGRNLLVLASDISAAAQHLNQKINEQASPTEYIDFIYRQIELALPYLKQAAKDAEKINTGLLPGDMRVYFETLKTYLPTTYQNLEELKDVFEVVLEILGHESEQRYLVLFQNNNELRATGGFIGSFAIFDIYQGQVIGIEVPRGGTYDLDAGQVIKYKAPKALSLINPDFNIWDANWWSDFPTSAKKISEMYQKSGGSSVDGVIAVNSDVLKELLVVLGPVRLDQFNIEINSDNLYQALQQQIEIIDAETNEPKAIIADLVPNIMQKLINFEGDKTILAETLIKVLSTKDIQIYSTHKDIQSELVKFGWAGDMKNAGFDYLQIVNTNIAGGKTDNDIVQTIDHQAEILSDGHVVNTLRITRTNNGPVDNPFAGIDGGNMDYMRIYVPLGSQLLEASGFDHLPESLFRTAGTETREDEQIAKEESKIIVAPSQTEVYESLDHTVFANWQSLTPGQTKTVYIKYTLPYQLDLGDPLVNDWFDKIFKKDSQLDNYSLLVQPQAGASQTILNSSVLLPDNSKIVWSNSTQPDKLSITDYLVSFSGQLTSDQYYGFIMATK